MKTKIDKSKTMIKLGPQEPPSDPRIFNRRQPDGTFPALANFFNVPLEKIVNSEIKTTLENRYDEIILRLQTGLFPGHEERDELYKELAEIHLELQRL